MINMLKSDELKVKLNDAKNKAEGLQKADEIKNVIDEIKNIKAQIELAEIAEADATVEIENKIEKDGKDMELINVVDKIEDKVKTKENASCIRAMIKKTLGKGLTEAENALLVGGANGEGYILPVEIITRITKLVRQYKSLSTVLGYMPVSALTGSFPVENFEMVSALVDFADGTPIGDISDISFKNVSFSLKEKAGFISLSNTLLGLTDNDLIAYVSEVFARKLVVTQNAMGIATLKAGKTAKEIADWKALKSAINKDLTEAVKGNLVIVVNQDGFDELDSALDGYGRPVLQPNPTNATQKLFMGYPVAVFDNALIPTVATKAPIFFGDLQDAVKFVGNGMYSFASDKSVGFLSNVTVARIITYIDCISIDSSDKAYIYGELTIGA
jgi:HK97 family phage major capsid protein